jgi:hypothetical protein
VAILGSGCKKLKYIHDEIKSTLHLENTLLSPHALSEILKIKIYKIIVLPVVL